MLPSDSFHFSPVFMLDCSLRSPAPAIRSKSRIQAGTKQVLPWV